MWPVELCISSLPPHLRMDADYLLLGGIWLGPAKPDMKTILQPVISKIESLKVSLKTCQGEKQLRAKLLLSVFDLPARAAAVNMMQYNGRYGCLYCLDEGKHINHRRIYLPSERHTPRNDTQMNRWAGRKKKEIDKALLRIKPSYEFRRTPRSIHTSKYWKASEYRAWLLIYSIPVLLQVDFPADYLYHFSLQRRLHTLVVGGGGAKY